MNLLDLFVKIGVKDEASDKLGGITTGAIAKASAMGQAMYDATKFVASKAVEAGKAIVGGAVEGYASYEQLAGGVKKLYGAASDTVMKFAQDAYKTSGISANQYMEQATSFSAALINSLGGDTAKAARQTDVAMRAISDNVNTFGSDMDSVQMAFQGFAKQNYTMLDNLKLGYGGTKQEMERLIADAEKYAKQVKNMGFDEYAEQMKNSGLSVDELRKRYDELSNSTDLTIDNFSDMVDAIDIIQEKQGIAGTTAKEAMSTIEGSWNSAKASWDNLLVAIGSGDGEMVSQSVTGLVDSIFGTFSEEAGKREGGLVNNLLPVLQNVGNALVQQLPTIAGQLVEAFVTAINGAFGTDFQVDGISQAFSDMSTKAQEAFDQIGQIASGFWAGFSSTFDASSFQSTFENIQSIAGQVFDFLSENSDEIGAAFGIAADVLGTVADAITTVADALGPFLPLIAGAVAALAGFSAIQPIIALVTGAFTTLTTVILPAMGMVQSFGGAIALVTTLLGGPIPILVAIVGAIVAFIATNEDARKTLLKAWNAVMNFFKGIPKLWNNVWAAVTDTLKKTVSKAIEMWQELKSNATSKFNEIKNNMAKAASAAKDNVVQAFQNLKDGASQKIGDLISYVKTLPSNIKSAIGNLASAMQQKGRDIIDGIKNGVVNRWDDLRAWLAGIPSRVLSSIGSVAGTLAQKGCDIISGLKSGLTGAWGSVSGWVSGIPTRIKNALGSVGSLLSSAGHSIINGLKSGMVSAFANVKKWVSGVAGTIRRLKGPLDYDKTVLIDNGEALMYGLQKGLSTSFEGKVKPYVKSMAGEMSDAFNVPSVSVGGTARSKYGPSLTVTIGSMTVRNRDDAEYMAQRISDIWSREIGGTL